MERIGYIWLFKKFKKYCVWFGTYKKRFVIRDHESLNSIPVFRQCHTSMMELFTEIFNVFGIFFFKFSDVSRGHKKGKSHWLFSQKVRSQMFDKALNTPLLEQCVGIPYSMSFWSLDYHFRANILSANSYCLFRKLSQIFYSVTTFLLAISNQ